MNKLKNNFVSILSLFTSFSTLLCCALPALFVTLGLGAVVAGIISNLPFLTTITKYKEWVFLFAAFLVGLNVWIVYGKKRIRSACIIPDKKEESACETASRWNKIVLRISFAFLLIGVIMAYLAFPLMGWLKS